MKLCFKTGYLENSLQRFPWLKRFMPGEPGCKEGIVRDANSVLQNYVNDPDVFIGISPEKGHGLEAWGMRPDKAYLVVARLGDIEGTAMIQETVRDRRTNEPYYQLKPLDIECVAFGAGLMSREDQEKFSAKLSAEMRKWDEEAAEPKKADAKEQLIDKVDYASREPVSVTMSDGKKKKPKVDTPAEGGEEEVADLLDLIGE